MTEPMNETQEEQISTPDIKGSEEPINTTDTQNLLKNRESELNRRRSENSDQARIIKELQDKISADETAKLAAEGNKDGLIKKYEKDLETANSALQNERNTRLTSRKIQAISEKLSDEGFTLKGKLKQASVNLVLDLFGKTIIIEDESGNFEVHGVTEAINQFKADNPDQFTNTITSAKDKFLNSKGATKSLGTFSDSNNYTQTNERKTSATENIMDYLSKVNQQGMN
jgi:hypothetical protein